MIRSIASVGALLTVALFLPFQASAQEPNIWEATGEGDIETLRALIKAGVDVNGPIPGTGATPLVIAAAAYQPRAASILIKSGAEVNWQGPQDGGTALHAAAFVGADKVAKVLIKNGADVLLPNGTGQVASQLIDISWADTQYVASMLQLELVEAEVMEGRTKIGRLVDREMEKRARKEPWIAVYTGNNRAMRRHVRRIDDLSEVHADLGMTMLTMAALHGHSDVVATLVDGGADPNATNSNGSTPLHAAALMGRVDVFEMLLANGGDTTRADDTGSKPIDVARLDWMATEQIAGVLRVPFDFDAVTSGKKAIEAMLSEEQSDPQ